MDLNDVCVNELSMDGQVMPELEAAAVFGMTEAESEQSHSAYLTA